MVQGAIYDITVRKQMEKSLRDSESRFRSLIEQSPLSTILYKPDGQPTYGNPASAKLWNMPPELVEHVYQTYNIFNDQQLMDQGIMPNIKKGFAGELSETIPIRYDPQQTDPHYVGPPRWLQAYIYPVKDEDKSTSEVVVMHLDVTERKKAEDALADSHERLITVLDSIDADVYASDMTTNEILFMNQHMRDSFDGNLVGQICWQAFRDEAGPCPHCTNDQLLTPDGKPAGVVAWEGQNPITGRWYINYDRAIKWVDDRMVRLQVATDFTDRKHAEEEVRRYAKRIETLLEIEKVITSTLNLDEVLSIIMVELKKVIAYDSISLQILRENSLEIVACRGFNQPDEIIGLTFPLNPKFPNCQVVETKVTLAIEDVTREYPHFQRQSSKYNSGHIRSWLGVPLKTKGVIKGMISVDRSEVAPFSDAEIQMASAVASQAALAIENASLFSEAQRRLRHLSSLRRIDEVIASNLDLRLTLNIILGQIRQQLEVDAATILLYQPDLQYLEHVASSGFRTEAIQLTNLRLGEGFAGRAALEQRIVRVSDLSQLQTGFLRSPEFRDEGFVDYVGVPMITKGTVTGVLEIYHRHSLEPGREWTALLKTLAGQTAIAIDNIRLFEDLQSSNMQLFQAYDATIEGWARALEMRDMETEGHSRRVVETTLKLARKLGIKDKDLIHIRRGTLLHDIGKMGVPDAILQKRGNLNAEEWQIMQKHPVYAHKWLSQITYLKSALDIPYCHHEKWDGTGYPRGLEGEEIPLAARIFAVVDVWDALRSDRPYRKAWADDKVIKYLETERNKHFDPRVVDAFLGMLENGELQLWA
jgi:PAS domain S-box-containing protein